MMRPDCAALLVTAGHPDHDNCSEVVFMKVRSRETALCWDEHIIHEQGSL